jgi:hypothetical protein
MATKTFERIADARRRDRDREDTLRETVEQFLGRPLDSGYLGDPATVDALVRTALARVVKARIDAGALAAAGQTFPDPADVARKEAAEFAQIVLGQNPSFQPISEQWNGPNGSVLGQIRRRYNLQMADPMDVAAFPFWAVVRAYLDASNEEAAGHDWQHLIDGEIELCVAVIVGTDLVSFPLVV